MQKCVCAFVLVSVSICVCVCVCVCVCNVPTKALYFMVYSTQSGYWLVIIEPLLVVYSTISLKVLYSTFVKSCYVEP